MNPFASDPQPPPYPQYDLAVDGFNQQGYPPPNMGIYDQFPQQPEVQGFPPPDPFYCNFYDDSALSMQPQSPPYQFLRRINRMNWDFLDKVDVTAIARNGDTNSVEQLLQPVAFANITNEDTEQFATRAALHAFLLLQMAVELLLHKLNNTPPPAPPQQSQPHITPQVVSNYEAKIDLLKKDVEQRNHIITSLEHRIKETERQRDEALARVQTSKSPHNSSKVGNPPIHKNSHDDSGSIHLETQYMEYEKQRPRRPPKKTSTPKSKPPTSSHIDWGADPDSTTWG